MSIDKQRIEAVRTYFTRTNSPLRQTFAAVHPSTRQRSLSLSWKRVW